MLVGPVFTRELAMVTRRPRLYVARGLYVASLLVLMCTAWLVLTGTQNVSSVGDLAHFGSVTVGLLAPLQLVLAVAFSALVAASAVAQEKDRRTLILLLLTKLTNHELVLGRLLASMLLVLVMLAAALPLFMLTSLLGGVSFDQVGRIYLVTTASALVAGSLGSTVALWRESTFQTLAVTALLLVAWIALWEVAATGAFGASWLVWTAYEWATMASPWRAILAAVQPTYETNSSPIGGATTGFLVAAGVGAVAINGVAIAMVRTWNPSRGARRGTAAVTETSGDWGVGPQSTSTPGVAQSVVRRMRRSRRVWDNPILWREVCTWAYGRKVLAVRAGYLLIFALAAAVLHEMIAADPAPVPSIIPPAALSLVPLLVLSLILLNALAVTAMTSERDGRALDLLLVSDLSPSEVVFGKLIGVFYCSKEIILLPLLLCTYLWFRGAISGENVLYLLGGLLIMNLFVAVLGIHVGMTYSNSRHAIGVSLGTIVFLFIGIATCMRIMIAFSGSFHVQLQPFLAFMLGGGLGLYVVLGLKNPSPAIGVAAFGAPFATFYAITSFILGYPLAVFFVTVATYGFATAAMLIPALYEFDVIVGRTQSE